MNESRREPIVVPPGGGFRFENIEFLARSEDTHRFNMGIITVPPHSEGPEAHIHKEEDDSFFILEGELELDHEGETFTAGKGTFVLIPPGVKHTFRNTSGEVCRVLNVHAPAGFDKRVMEDD
jgi:mannose-6-phosphate isomerase-like protein (cupin superfamily)